MRDEIIEMKYFTQKNGTVQKHIIHDMDKTGNAEPPFAARDGGKRKDNKAQQALNQHQHIITANMGVLCTFAGKRSRKNNARERVK
jgi:hypothetical protein